jgi:hypothetical protein
MAAKGRACRHGVRDRLVAQGWRAGSLGNKASGEPTAHLIERLLAA